MRAASRAIGHLFAAVAVVVAILVAAPPPTQAQAPPLCPPTVGDLPLSIATPFSGTIRATAGGPSRLLCAYGEGVEPSAVITLTWEPDAVPACADSATEVAAELRAQPFQRAAADLVVQLGGRCAPAGAAGVPIPALAAAVAVVLVAAAVGARNHRRHRSPTPVALPEPAPRSGTTDRTPTPGSSTQNEQPAAERAPLPRPQPVLAMLSGPSGRAFARTGAGQWATVSAVAYACGNPVVGDLARAGALRALEARRPPRPDLVALARAVAHQAPGGDR